MPICSYCTREIDHLIVRRKDWKKVILNEDSGKIQIRKADWGNDFQYSFRCPLCYKYLFYSPKQAAKFLKRGMDKRYKTKW